MRAEAKQHSFYKSGKLQLLLHADSSCTQTFRELEVPLAITHTAGTGLSNVTCLAVDGLSTALSTEGRLRLAYSPYGYAGDSPEQSVAFTGQRWDPISECYLLGAGRVPYSPVLMRRTVSDPFSPFGKGGINSYMYCNADPINYADPSGRMRLPAWLKWLTNRVKQPPKISRDKLIKLNAELEQKNRDLETAHSQEREADEKRHQTELKQERSYGRKIGRDARAKLAEREADHAFEEGFISGQAAARAKLRNTTELVRPISEAPYAQGFQDGFAKGVAFAQMNGSPEAGGTLQQAHTNRIPDPAPMQSVIRT